MLTNKEEFKQVFQKRLVALHGTEVQEATTQEIYKTLGSLVREYISENWINTNASYKKSGVKQVYYFSLEFLLGRLMGSNLLNLDIYNVCKEGLLELGIDLDDIEEAEPDAGLGNGGLGRLAACFLDSLASLELPGHGCGIRYKYGLFEQKIINGYQVELPDNWLKEGNVWEIRKSDKAVEVKFGGYVTTEQVDGRLSFLHHNYEKVLAVPYDMPVVGYKNEVVNTLRLWSAETIIGNFDAYSISTHDQRKIIEYKRSTEAITEFLYPDDSHIEGRTLRLKQQYFLVSAGIQSILHNHKKHHHDVYSLPENVAIHVNDTHPVLAVPELMRILLDDELLSWDDAWEIMTKTISYTNHTTLAEALETWPVDLMRSLLPRVFMIIEEINRRFCQQVWADNPGNWELLRSVEIIRDGVVRMANLAIVGSYSVNGVAQVHTEIIKKREMKHFYQYFPEKFNNKTNGITHRRWLLRANPLLANVITELIGSDWIKNPTELQQLSKYVKDASFQEQIRSIKHNNKLNLAKIISKECGLTVDVGSIFDVQIKRLHAYKRQVLNVLHIMDLYNRLKEDPTIDMPPRTFIFGAKAAPSYHFAKKVIKLINTVASIINNDKYINDKLKVVFLENYRVSMAEVIIPATDISEQISTASKEASGTGNMKFMMNGAITLGTLDGANIEIEEAVGDDNIFIFGLTPNEVLNYHQVGGYSSWDMYNTHPRIRKVMEQLITGEVAQQAGDFKDIYDSLLIDNDEYFVLKDFIPYVDAQLKAGQAYMNQNKWTQMAIENIAQSGKFSSDRTIKEYASEIWRIR
ncbi:glycogen/starch/alpha-glucan phosphorylase [Desulfuribacillus alkaliarsenatis]|uniref:Alpha-1,4 glucan phosphorylase n=1 Tax=Desulfuribacillus alkaliarsenatis TaxID=766136 RepID=A0A1E5G0E3_9FIRM|nr:glycogen/starch/alpha-glucan phosphorylase [Desulfuribacillus alkaliarsenatis]OEF96292.1 glycogen phosphorylase [Desulfuribacillus alkaliarsenatis]